LYRVANGSLISFFKNQSIYPCYHIVKDEKVAHIENLYPYKNEEQFRHDLEVLLKNYKPLNPFDLLVNKKITNQFLISFDDGLEEIYSIVYPILKEKRINAIFFINPDFVDNTAAMYKHLISMIISHLKNSNISDGSYNQLANILSIRYSTKQNFFKTLKETKYTDCHKIEDVLKFLDIDIQNYLQKQKLYVTKNQIQEMINDGFAFGGHTMSHPQLHQMTFEEQKVEIISSIDWLKLHFGINYSFFAFPFTDRNVSKQLLTALFQYDNSIVIFGNSGLKKDFDDRIIQRFSLESPNKKIEKQIVTENLYKYYNKIISKYKIKRV
jgi:peptidoglycan/xylan/chitin deacetylase (PgdA/CDA1 family)